jgi:pimeloyl-ACP methyl ester carboxylesterase
MLLFVVSGAVSAHLQPVIFVPDILRSILRITANGSQRHSYCPNVTDHPVWMNWLFFFTPFANCMLEWLTLPNPLATVTTDSIGSLSGLLGHELFGLNGQYLRPLVDDLVSLGHAVNETLFGAPYDWRYGLPHPTFDAGLDALILDVSRRTGQKVVLLGHSYGAVLLAEHLAINQTNPDVLSKVDRLVLVAPSWGGAPSLSIGLTSGKLYAPLPFASDLSLFRFVRSLESLALQAPHGFFSQSKRVFTGLKTVWASAAAEYLVENHMVIAPDRAREQMAHAKRTPAPIPLPVKILFNSGIETPFGSPILDNGPDLNAVQYDRGDGTVLSDATEVLCRHWARAGHDVECVDLASAENRNSHSRMLTSAAPRAVIAGWLAAANASEALGPKRDQL